MALVVLIGVGIYIQGREKFSCASGPIWAKIDESLQSRKQNSMEVNGCCQLFDYQHSLKYIILCSAEE